MFQEHHEQFSSKLHWFFSPPDHLSIVNHLLKQWPKMLLVAKHQVWIQKSPSKLQLERFFELNPKTQKSWFYEQLAQHLKNWRQQFVLDLYIKILIFPWSVLVWKTLDQ